MPHRLIQCLFSSITLFITALPTLGQDRDRFVVAVFNFGMAGDTPEWKWLEKGIADMVTNDLIQAGYPVVARDEMQATAMAVDWEAQEMVEKMGSYPLAQIKDAIKIDLLISGVYQIEVEKEAISFHYQIIDMETSDLIKTQKVTGKLKDILGLRRQLSAAITTFLEDGQEVDFSDFRAVPWSENVDALRAHYEGIDLFDAGRYSEAWLKFRQATRAYPDFADAQYWQGKMQYFLDRYDHARLDLESFLDYYSDHPLAGAAVREYCHTFESQNPETEELLELYREVGSKYASSRQQIGGRDYSMSDWTTWRSMKLLASRGQLKESWEIAKNNTDAMSLRPGLFWSEIYSKAYGSQTADPEVFHSMKEESRSLEILHFDEGQTTLVDEEWRWARRQNNDYVRYLVTAPKGKLFDSMRVWPISSKGINMVVQVNISQVKRGDIYISKSQSPPVHISKVDGLFVPSLAEVPFIDISLDGYSGFWPYDKEVSLDGIKIEATFKDIPEEWGSLEISSPNCDDYRVISGTANLLRGCSGRVDYMKPGKHRVRFVPFSRQRWPMRFRETTEVVYAPVEKIIEIKAGETTRVSVEFPWSDIDRWEGWQTATVDAPKSAELDLQLAAQLPEHDPCILMEDDRIRLIWSEAGDLWTCESNDGQTFTNRRKLGLPISSAWNEYRPRCRLDQNGRYVLGFMSDRNKDRVATLYLAWSRDFENWTSPKQVRDRYVTDYDLMSDPKTNKILIAETADNEITIWEPDDHFQWQQKAAVTFEDDMRQVRLLPPNGNGQYEMIAVQHGEWWVDPIKRGYGPRIHHLSRWLSPDLKAWKEDRDFQTKLAFEARFGMDALRDRDGKTIACRFGTSNTDFRSSRGQMIWYDHENTVQRSMKFSSIVSHDGTFAWHPKWGAYFCWFSASSRREHRPVGPLVIHGDDFSPFMARPLSEKNIDNDF